MPLSPPISAWGGWNPPPLGVWSYCYMCSLIKIPSLKKAERKQNTACFLLQTTCINSILAPLVWEMCLKSTPTQVHLFSIFINSIISANLRPGVVIYTLTWEPRAAQGSHSDSHWLPAPCHKSRFYLFFPVKVDPLNLQSQNQVKTHSRGSPEFFNQNLRPIG